MKGGFVGICSGDLLVDFLILLFIHLYGRSSIVDFVSGVQRLKEKERTFVNRH